MPKKSQPSDVVDRRILHAVCGFWGSLCTTKDYGFFKVERHKRGLEFKSQPRELSRAENIGAEGEGATFSGQSFQGGAVTNLRKGERASPSKPVFGKKASKVKRRDGDGAWKWIKTSGHKSNCEF